MGILLKIVLAVVLVGALGFVWRMFGTEGLFNAIGFIIVMFVIYIIIKLARRSKGNSDDGDEGNRYIDGLFSD